MWYATDKELVKCYINQQLTDSMLSTIVRDLSKQYDIDILKYHSIVTLDYKSDRLRIYVDDNKIITSITIG